MCLKGLPAAAMQAVQGAGPGHWSRNMARKIATAHGGALGLVDGEAGYVTFELSLPAGV